ncbi:MAG: hypothetical protein ACE5E5_02270 [Phycisphaerae bacterium]
MLFWEAVNGKKRRKRALVDELGLGRGLRLPYDNRCRGTTKKGKRCRARIREGSEYCVFHDPEVPSDVRRRIAAKGGKSKRRLSHIPDGYLRPLTDRSSIAKAMDRLYREVRLGVLTPEMGRVLFDILCRLLDTDFAAPDAAPVRRRGGAYRQRGKLKELLKPHELEAWDTAVAHAPATQFQLSDEERIQATLDAERKGQPAAGGAALPAAS